MRRIRALGGVAALYSVLVGAGCVGEPEGGDSDGLNESPNSEADEQSLAGGMANGAQRFSAGWLHSCQVTRAGGVSCSGYNRYGQLGDGTNTDRLSPTPVAGISRATGVAAGATHSCALLDDGTVRCWGDNSEGALGDGTLTSRTRPVKPGISHVVAIAAGASHTCALRHNGTVSCWGSNLSGALGTGGPTRVETKPKTVADIEDAVAIAAEGDFTCALRVDTTVSCWGANGLGQLGDGSLTERHRPVRVAGLTGVKQIQAGGGHACALKSDGTVECWGWNRFGQLGTTVTYHDRLVYYCGGSIIEPGDACETPIDVGEDRNPLPSPVVGVSRATAISLGGNHSCALLQGGATVCWGYNSTGQLGDGTTLRRWQAGPTLLTPARSIESGWGHNCATLTNGSVSCWGTNMMGEAGTGKTSSSLTTGGYGYSAIPESSRFEPF